jgi:hypothetical protein
MRYLLWVLLSIACMSQPAYAAEILVNAGENLQAAINASACGDTIKLEDGAVWQGYITLPERSGCAEYTTITRQGTVPDAYDVIAGCYQKGPTFVAEQAKRASCRAAIIAQYETNAPVLLGPTTVEACVTGGVHVFIPWNSDYWKFVGIEIEEQSTSVGCPVYVSVSIGLRVSDLTNATVVGDLPHHIIFDRVSCHGNPTGDYVRCILANGNDIEVINSVFYEIHSNAGGDSQAFMSYNSEGRHVIRNNYIEAAGENLLWGGADPVITDLLPTDITVEDNFLTKDWTWWAYCDRLNTQYGYACTPGPTSWMSKNNLECKICVDLTFHGNIIENSWQQDQPGPLVLFQSVAQQGPCAWCVVEGVTGYGNVIRHGGVGINIAGASVFNGGSDMGGDMYFHDNLIYGLRRFYSIDQSIIGAYGNCFDVISGSSGTAAADSYTNVWFIHNTCDQNGNPGNWGETGAVGSGGAAAFTTPIVRDNIFCLGPYGGAITFQGAWPSYAEGTEAWNAYAPGGYVLSNNVYGECGGVGNTVPHPADNWMISGAAWLAIFTDYTTYDFTVATGSAYEAGGARDASDGLDLGADMSLLPDAPAMVEQRRKKLHGRFGR